jgi:uncharacterized protein
MKKLLLSAIILLGNYGFSQEKIPFVDFEKLKEEIALGLEEGDFQKPLEILDRVNQNDSTYCEILVTKSYYLLNLNEFEEALEVVEEGMGRDCSSSNLSYMINKGVALENLERLEDANELYDEAIKIFPKNALLWNNKGVVLEKLDRVEEAINAYQRAIMYSPTYRKPHLRLGNISYKQEKMAQAMLCFNTYLLLEPDADDAFNILSSFNNLVISKNPNSANPNLSLSQDDDSFEMIDLILENKIALNEGYEIGNKINVPLVKQNHALLDQLQTFEGEGGFWSQTYVPLYQWVLESGSFDNFIYTLSYSIQNDDYKKIIEKNIEGVKGFVGDFQNKWGELLSQSTYRPDPKDEGLFYNYLNSYVEAVGKAEGQKTVGEWKFYLENGSYGGKGYFNDKGERQDTWTWYYQNGQIKEVGNYSQGLLQGENLGYYENGRPKYVANFLNDKLDGEYLYFNERGAMMQKKNFKAGELEGLFQSFFAVGEELLEFHVPYKADKIEDKLIEYYANGEIYEEGIYRDGELNGSEKSYNFNRSLFSEIKYENGQPVGEYKTYYSNQNIKESGQYLDGVFHGPFKTYFFDGTLASELNYNKGELHGLYRFYDKDGKLYHDYEYKKGKIVAYSFYNKAGEVIDKGSKKGGEFFYRGYTPLGILNVEGLYDISGGKTGRWKFYTSNGVLEAEGDFLNDMNSGEYREYFLNGEVNAISNYDNGVLSGYFVKYHPNGNMQSQGWFQDDQRVGEWRDYYINGELLSINYYHKGDYHGEQEYYGVSGNLSHKTTYKFGNAMKDAFYDKSGKVFETIDYDLQDGKYQLTNHHFNGEISSTTTFLNGIKHGLFVYFDFDGKKIIEGNFLNGNEHGEWNWYHPNGQVERKAIYDEGKLHGEVRDFYDTGAKEGEYYYEYGEPSGIWSSYYHTGEKETVTHYLNGENHGRKEFYSPAGKLQLVRFYNNDRLIGYSYEDEKGKEHPMIELPNETGIIKAYYDNGNVSRQMEYKNGVMVNSYSAFYYDGTPETHITYKDGFYNGAFTEYYPNGNKRQEKHFLYDNLHGKVIVYHENGNIKEERTYINNAREGNTGYYDESGELIKKEDYINDEVFSSEVF